MSFRFETSCSTKDLPEEDERCCRKKKATISGGLVLALAPEFFHSCIKNVIQASWPSKCTGFHGHHTSWKIFESDIFFWNGIQNSCATEIQLASKQCACFTACAFSLAFL